MALKNSLNLNGVTQMELQSIRKIGAEHKLMSVKYGDYAEKCECSQLKQILSQASQDAQMTAQNLANSL